jgi:membrane associated rhomboid family serine protease
MTEVNAAGTRIKVRELWRIFVFMFLSAGFYRAWWHYATNADLARFGRARTWGERPAISCSPGASLTCMLLAWIGYPMLWAGALPWGGALELDWGWRIGLTMCSLPFLVPAMVSVVRTRDRVHRARQLAGLPVDDLGSGRLFRVLVAAEAIGVPVWMFYLQSRLNDMWARYPVLHDEDLFGELAPAGPARDAAIVRRDELHERRLRRIARDVENQHVRPWVTSAFLVLCCGVFVWQLARFGFVFTEREVDAAGAFSVDLPGAWWRFWAANVLHGNVGHITANMTIWCLIAFHVERAVGKLRMLALVVVGAAGTSLGAMIDHPHEAGLGASGIVFAAMGLAVVMDPRARHAIGKFGVTMSILGVMISFTPGISTGGHMGGLTAGVLLGLVIRGVWKVTPATLAEPPPERFEQVTASAPLAPQRLLTTAERLQHLNRRHRDGVLTDVQYDELRAALLRAG